MSRKTIIAANWKLNHGPAETAAFLEAFLPQFQEQSASVDMVVAPPFVSLGTAAEKCAGAPGILALAAQNVSDQASGAYTGETSVSMLKEVGVEYVIIGHSERRSLYGEDDAFINRKLHAILAGGLKPILCIGESLEERDGGRLESVLAAQLEGSLAGVEAAAMEQVVVAYEPVWAIGTGRTATPEQAQETQAYVRSVLARLFGAETADGVRIQYGGSVKPENAAELIRQPDIDGFLVGGASLVADSFAAIVRAAEGAA